MVQPGSLFNSESSNDEEYPQYYLGVALGFSVALAAAMTNISQVLVTRDDDGHVVTRNHLMICLGLWNMILSLVTLPLISNRVISSPWSLTPVSWSLLLVSSLITLAAVWMIYTAVSLTQNPTLISMVRSTEIIMSLITETIINNTLPNYLSVIGALLVNSFNTWI